MDTDGKNMKRVGYLSVYNALNILSWSGVPYFQLKMLLKSGYACTEFGNFKINKFIKLKITLIKIYYKLLLSKKYLTDRSPEIVGLYIDQINSNQKLKDCDIFFTPSSILAAKPINDKPIIFWADATFAGMIDFYPEFSNLCNESIYYGQLIEQSALSNCKVALYSSEWAAKSAIENYVVDPKKVKVVPFGPNIECNRTMGDIKHLIYKKNIEVCKLLFVGVDWIRKGGDVALSIAIELNKRGVKTELNVVGCSAPEDAPNFIINHGFIAKNNKIESLKLEKLFSECHFLVVPSRAECYGIVFAEASSFGVPSIATNIGGIPTVVKSGINGQTFGINATTDEYCSYIQEIISNEDCYNNLALSAFKFYLEELSWDVAGEKIKKIINEIQ